MIPQLRHQLLSHRKRRQVFSLLLQSTCTGEVGLSLAFEQVRAELRVCLVVLLVDFLAL